MADASVFAALSDKVVYVIRQDYAMSSQIFDCIQSFSDNGARICGFVLNCSSRSGSAGGYGYGYGYGYGGKYGSKYGGYGYSREKSTDRADRK